MQNAFLQVKMMQKGLLYEFSLINVNPYIGGRNPLLYIADPYLKINIKEKYFDHTNELYLLKFILQNKEKLNIKDFILKNDIEKTKFQLYKNYQINSGLYFRKKIMKKIKNFDVLVHNYNVVVFVIIIDSLIRDNIFDIHI
ncbi:hypothetical protein LY90DRAFT_669374 [Neocallimastix californiae]|uniref:Uncharacterized protein n=1 Tax=Neocallimastix californiae TaxID=1754190 RepID=A0A1Y2DB59_9FUNG|nr:hypothetical protein LY90DRAFT_669374 [Neocallimastix californiae]|eukprot:ORY56499.1 hypothetical protein LY90DRAFT_669374 [Neocallimastix californiae]